MKFAAHYVQIDNWLSVEEHRHLLNYVAQQQSHFVSADMTIEGSLHRKAWVLFSFPEFSSIVEARIRAIFPDILAQLSLPSLEISKIEAQLTAHNDGSYYKLHTDNGIYDREPRKINCLRMHAQVEARKEQLPWLGEREAQFACPD